MIAQISKPHPQPCSHEGPCGLANDVRSCGFVQRAQSLKYSTNHTWQFAEIAPALWALYSPIRRELVALGTIDEILEVYRARKPFVPVKRAELPLSRPAPSRFQNIVVNI
jgi:hypothetical protein